MTQLWGIEVDVLALFLSFTAVVVAVGKEVILPIWFKPKIVVLWDNNEECIQRAHIMRCCEEHLLANNPELITTSKKICINSTWLRLKILNDGRTTAKRCYVKLTAIRDAKDELIKPFDPCPLKWTIFKGDKINLAKKEYHLIDLAYQQEGTSFFIPETLSLPNSLLVNISNKLSTGKFTLDVTVYGDNIEPVSKQIDILVFEDYKKLKFDLD